MSASTAVLKAELRLFSREPFSLFWIVAFPAVLLTILGLIPSFREPDPGLGGSRVIDLYVPVNVLLAMIMAGIQALPPVLSGYRERGILRRMSTTPVRPAALLTAQIVLHFAAALFSSLLVIAIGRLAFDVALPGHLPGYLLALLLGALGALALGAAVTAVTPTVKATTVVGSIVFFPMMFFAGVWVPVQAMPEVLRGIVEYSPFGAASQALHQAAEGGWPDWTHLGVTAAWAAVLIAAAVRWFRWE
ncbi:ABC-2 type transport system permease protein [Thermomonospora echinospora]|uniref:Transport permease protein n=1 Tax=Thermomonospora echinospora TaxID=1992 RepID=A0A1H5X9E1_9ACTN|nr:ABC transporter permease [Thermomonospora echinospora]SEG08359.1 ABC-2 type transport system permease protein [Thermomonospora echinospora]